jgi:hypothetical protein
MMRDEKLKKFKEEKKKNADAKALLEQKVEVKREARENATRSPAIQANEI